MHSNNFHLMPLNHKHFSKLEINEKYHQKTSKKTNTMLFKDIGLSNWCVWSYIVYNWTQFLIYIFQFPHLKNIYLLKFWRNTINTIMYIWSEINILSPF